MPYLPTGNAIIIARNGYGGSTATGLGAVNPATGKDGNPYVAPKPAPAKQPSTWDKIWGFVKDAGSAAVKIYGQQQQQAGQQQAYQQIQQPSTPGWVMPVAIGGAVLGAALILRSGKRKNPSRGKGRRRQSAFDMSVDAIMGLPKRKRGKRRKRIKPPRGGWRGRRSRRFRR